MLQELLMTIKHLLLIHCHVHAASKAIAAFLCFDIE